MSNPFEKLTMEQKAVEFTTASSAALEKAAAIYQEKQATDAKVAALIPDVVKAMVDNQRIEPGQAEKLAQLLRQPDKVLELLQKTAGHRNDAELAADPARLGQPEGWAEGRAGGGDTRAHARTPFVGQRSSTQAQSDIAMLAALNIAPQQS